jgi:hypothetical protein
LLETEMSTTRRSLYAALAALSLAFLPGQLVAQDHAMGGDGASTFGEEFPHGVTFWTRREPDGCTLCAPAIDINAGLYKMEAEPDALSETFIRLHTQWGLGIRHMSLSADLLWIPGLTQSTPSVAFVAQYEPISQAKRFYVGVGGGMISGRDQDGNGFSLWGQATVAYRSPIHDIAPFVQVGQVLSGDDREMEFLFGVAHPIAPYRMHYTIK